MAAYIWTFEFDVTTPANTTAQLTRTDDTDPPTPMEMTMVNDRLAPKLIAGDTITLIPRHHATAVPDVISDFTGKGSLAAYIMNSGSAADNRSFWGQQTFFAYETFPQTITLPAPGEGAVCDQWKFTIGINIADNTLLFYDPELQVDPGTA
jgi:hypothetical protein